MKEYKDKFHSIANKPCLDENDLKELRSLIELSINKKLNFHLEIEPYELHIITMRSNAEFRDFLIGAFKDIIDYVVVFNIFSNLNVIDQYTQIIAKDFVKLLIKNNIDLNKESDDGGDNIFTSLFLGLIERVNFVHYINNEIKIIHNADFDGLKLFFTELLDLMINNEANIDYKCENEVTLLGFFLYRKELHDDLMKELIKDYEQNGIVKHLSAEDIKFINDSHSKLNNLLVELFTSRKADINLAKASFEHLQKQYDEDEDENDEYEECKELVPEIIEEPHCP